MKPRLRDYLTIGMALLAILFCGYGVGFLLGEKKGRQNATVINLPASTSNEQKGLWVERTLVKFDRELQLTPEQLKLAAIEIAKTYDDIRKSRLTALRQYSTHIVDLHTRLVPHLDEDQKETVEEQRDRIQETLDLGFP